MMNLWRQTRNRGWISVKACSMATDNAHMQFLELNDQRLEPKIDSRKFHAFKSDMRTIKDDIDKLLKHEQLIGRPRLSKIVN